MPPFLLLIKIWSNMKVKWKILTKTPLQFCATWWHMWAIVTCHCGQPSCRYHGPSEAGFEQRGLTKFSSPQQSSPFPVIVTSNRSAVLIPCLTWLICCSRNNAVVDISVFPSGANSTTVSVGIVHQIRTTFFSSESNHSTSCSLSVPGNPREPQIIYDRTRTPLLT